MAHTPNDSELIYRITTESFGIHTVHVSEALRVTKQYFIRLMRDLTSHKWSRFPRGQSDLGYNNIFPLDRI